MTHPQRHRRVATVVLTALATLLGVLGGALAAAPAQATPITPRPFTGYAFDTCHAPTQEQMDVWLNRSPFRGVGIYISGDSRHCPYQPNLTPTWIRRQLHHGWRILPLTVGPQARCNGRHYDDTISQEPDHRYGEARRQGRVTARRAVRAARALGIPERSTLWNDLEHYDIGNTSCRQSALGFLSAWTNTLHNHDYRSGVYSSASSGVAALDHADELDPGAYTMPDRIWFGWGNGRHNTVMKPEWSRATSWQRNRVHQYHLGHYESHGGVRLEVDRDFVDVAGGTRPPHRAHTCGVRADWPRYRRLDRGDKGAQVKAAQCLLRRKHHLYHGRLSFHFNRRTYRAVRRFQRSHDLPVRGVLNRRTWTVLLAQGPSPVLKYGSSSNAVRRVQRGLNAAMHAGLAVTGVFAADTAHAVRDYQHARGLYRTGVVADQTWAQLDRGRH